MAEEGILQEKHSFSTNRLGASSYANNEYLREHLELVGIDCAEIEVVGSSEKKDILSLYDTSHHLIRQLSGKVNERIPLFDSRITVEFKSNRFYTDKGFTVRLLEKKIDTCFPELKEDFLKIGEGILHYGSSELADAIESHKKLLHSLNESVQQPNPKLDDLLPDMAKAFAELAGFYQKVTEGAANVHLQQTGALRDLEKLQKRVTRIIARLNQSATEYGGVAVQDDLISNDAHESIQTQQKLKISSEIYKKLASHAQDKQHIWVKLHGLQKDVIRPIEAYMNDIQVLLHFMKINIPVYQQTSSVALLRNSLLRTFSNLAELDKLKQAVSAIEKSETELKSALENLKKYSPL
jgi:prefoldin subunit 5